MADRPALRLVPSVECSANGGVILGADGYPMRVHRFRARSVARAAIACIHGIQSHAGWYSSSCQKLANAGFDTFFLDRRGSGANEKDRGHATGFKQLRDDLIAYLESVRRECPNVPLALLAISWGGKLAVATLKERPDLVDGLILLCPGWFAKVSPPLREQLAIGWSALLWPTRKFAIPLSDPTLFTQQPHWIQFLESDPLSLREGTARLLFTSRRLDSAIADAPEKIATPSLLLLAGQDRIIDNEASRDYFERFAASDKTVREYEDAHHTLEFEPNADEIYSDLIAWLGCWSENIKHARRRA